MRILFVSKDLPYATDGPAGREAWALSGQLVECGHEVTLLTAGEMALGVETAEHRGRTLVHLQYPSAAWMPVLGRTADRLTFEVAAFGWLRTHAAAYDVVHLHGGSGYLFAAVRPKASAPLVISVGDDRAPRFSRAAYAHADQLIVASEAREAQLAARCATPAAVVAQGVHVDVHRAGQVPLHGQLLAIADLSKHGDHGGIEVLLDAMAQVDERLELTVIGAGPRRAKLERRIRARGLHLRVRFVGAQDVGATRHYLARAFATVLPEADGARSAGVLEAGAAGRPVVAPVLPDGTGYLAHGSNGLSYPAGDVGALAVVLDHLYAAPDLAARLGQAGRAGVRARHDLTQVAEQYVELYRRYSKPPSPSTSIKPSAARRALART